MGCVGCINVAGVLVGGGKREKCGIEQLIPRVSFSPVSRRSSSGAQALPLLFHGVSEALV